MTASLFSTEQLEADVAFWAQRALKANSCSLSDGGRDTGVSSNSIVAIAYGICGLCDQEFPMDADDLAACYRAWNKLPSHRKNQAATQALHRAEMSVVEGSRLHALQLSQNQP